MLDWGLNFLRVITLIFEQSEKRNNLLGSFSLYVDFLWIRLWIAVDK